MFLKKKISPGEPRPILNIEFGPADWILEGLSLIALLSFFGFILYQYRLLPETIPTHFDATGTPDESGRKNTLWVMPAIALILYIILTFISRIPEKFNFPVKITTANARVQYILGLRLIRYLKFAIILIFFFIGYATVMIARNQMKTIGLWLLPVMIGGMLVPLILYLILAFRNK